MRYMLHTNICVYLLKRHPPLVLARLQALHEGEAVMSVVTYANCAPGLKCRLETASTTNRCWLC